LLKKTQIKSTNLNIIFNICSPLVGGGTNTFFGTDPRLGGSPLCMWFRRLFDLAESISVSDMYDLGWEEGGTTWQWCRRLWACEEELLGECRILLHDI